MVTKNNDTSNQNGEKGPSLWGWHTALSIAITIAIFIILASMVDLKKVWEEFSKCNKMYVLLAMVFHYGTYPVRGLRWRRCLIHMLASGGKAKFGLLVFFYNFVDNMVPAKLGDVYGAHLARINFGVPRSGALGSIVFLRMMDAWVILFLACLSSWILFSAKLPQSVLWALIGGGFIAVVATLIILAFFLLKKTLPSWLPDRIRDMIKAFHMGMWPKPREIIPVLVLTGVIWASETLWILFLVLGFGLKVSTMEVIFLTTIPLLASAFPLTPSGAGVVELTVFSCLRVIGVSAPLAVSLTVVNRFIDYWLHIGLGLLAWVARRKIGLRTWREVPINDPQQTPELKKLISQEDLS